MGYIFVSGAIQKGKQSVYFPLVALNLTAYNDTSQPKLMRNLGEEKTKVKSREKVINL